MVIKLNNSLEKKEDLLKNNKIDFKTFTVLINES